MLRHVWKQSLELKSNFFLLSSKRFKGHSHWQNTRHIKGLNDHKRSLLIQKYMWRMQGVINSNKGDSNPKSNAALASLLEQAKKDNVPAASLQNFLKRVSDQDIETQNLYLKGPENYVVVITYNRKRQQYFRQAMKKACRDNKIAMSEIPQIDDVYTTKGVIVSKAPSEDITLEKVEEDAIVAGAEEVEEIVSEGKEERVFQFITLQEDLWTVVKALKEQGWTMYEHKLELVPLYCIELPEEKVPQLHNFVTNLEEIPEVEKVVVNVA